MSILIVIFFGKNAMQSYCKNFIICLILLKSTVISLSMLKKQIQAVVDYIEEHLLEEIKMKDLTKVALMSQSSLYNVCSQVLGMPVKKYIRYRRLSLSAYDLIYSDQSILSLALKYGYSSSASFSRSFKYLYGQSPQHFKNTGIYTNAFPRIVLLNQVPGGNIMVNFEQNLAQLNEVIKQSPRGFLLDIDIDKFVSINQIYGSEIGDKVLQEVPRVLQRVLNQHAVNTPVIRIQGDEFAIVINSIETDQLKQLCSKMLAEVEKGLKFEATFVPLTISIGITAISAESKNYVDQAQSAMLDAKKSGKNQFKFSTHQ